MATALAQLHRQVCFGQSDGKIIWQPRIGCWYYDKLFAGEPLPEPYAGMSIRDIYRKLGCSARLYAEFNPCFQAIEPESVVTTERSLNETDTEITVSTPVGKQTEIRSVSPSSPAYIHVKWPISTDEELKVAMWRVENTTWEFDAELFRKEVNTVGDLGAPTIYIPRITVQDLFVNNMGVEQAVYALYDWPDLVAAYFKALDENHDRLIDVINASPIEIINFGDNVHCGTLPPRLFEQYVLPSYQRRCEKLHAGGKFVHAHWDGDVATLLPYVKDTGLDGIEAITPQPQGDVTLEQVKDALSDDIFLIDGIPAVYFDTTYSEEVLEECTRRLIELFAPKLVLGISDEISSTGDIERIRLVGRIVDEYNAKISPNA